jgi:acyl carrier protein
MQNEPTLQNKERRLESAKTMQNIAEVNLRLREFIAETFPLARNQPFSDDESLFASGIVDSLGIMDLVGLLEDEYAIVLSDEDFVSDNFETISRLAAFVETKRNGQIHV